jgi:hypothetical protein
LPDFAALLQKTGISFSAFRASAFFYDAFASGQGRVQPAMQQIFAIRIDPGASETIFSTAT